MAPRDSIDLHSLTDPELVQEIFRTARRFAAIASELEGRHPTDQRTQELATALDVIARLLLESTPPIALLAALTPLLAQVLPDDRVN